MEMLVMTIVGLLFLLAVAATLSSVWLERRPEKRAACSIPAPPLPCAVARDFSIVALSDAFEPETACIWQPQIEILGKVERAQYPGLEVEALRPVYQQFADRYPELYEGSDLESWLEAMEQADLVAWSGSKVRLTTAGVAFLKCRLPVTV